MQFAVGLGLTNDCNLACAHCYRDTVNIDRLSLDQVKQLCRSVPIRAINLGTGENALHPDFHEIVAYLRGLEVKLTITSNGFSAAELSDEELRWFHDIEFSLDFPTEAEQDAFRGPGNWRLIMEQLVRCRRLGVSTAVTAVMMSTNYNRLAAIARVAAEQGAVFRVNVYQAIKTDQFTLSYEQFWEGFRLLFAESEVIACSEPLVRAILGLKGRAHGCGVETVRLTPRAEVLPCVYWPERVLKLNDLLQLGHHVAETEVFRQLAMVPEFCRSCALVETCGGGCASRRRLRGRLDQPDEYCPLTRGDQIRLPFTQAPARELPKAASACTTIVLGKKHAPRA